MGSGSEAGLQRQLLPWSVELLPLAAGCTLAHPSSESAQQEELVRSRQGRGNSRDQRWGHPQARLITRMEAGGEQNGGT